MRVVKHFKKGLVTDKLLDDPDFIDFCTKNNLSYQEGAALYTKDTLKRWL